MAGNDVIVKITQKQVSGLDGFGIPLIIQGKGEAMKAYAECASLEDVLNAGYEKESTVYKQFEKIFMQDNHPKHAAVYTDTGKISEGLNLLKDKDFRQIIPIFGEGDDTLAELAAYVELTENRMLFIRAASASDLTDIGKMERTVAIIYSDKDACVEGAVVGATSGLSVGSFTYKNIVLRGVAPESLSDPQMNVIHHAGGLCIVRKAGDVVTSEGKTLSGEYVDIIDSRDYITCRMAYNAQKLLNTSSRITFDNTGISQLEGVVTNVLAEAYAMGMIAPNDDGSPAYSTNFATRTDIPEAERTARTYNGGRFSYTPAGAVHYAVINGILEM